MRVKSNEAELICVLYRQPECQKLYFSVKSLFWLYLQAAEPGNLQFCSTINAVSNNECGGNFENRICLLKETMTAIQLNRPEHLPLIVRISATEYIDYCRPGRRNTAAAKLRPYPAGKRIFT